MSKKLKITDGPMRHGNAFIQLNKDALVKAVVECFGLWHDGGEQWLAPHGRLFWTSSKAVATAKLHMINQAGWRVRSFDEWAESEQGKAPGISAKQDAVLVTAARRELAQLVDTIEQVGYECKGEPLENDPNFKKLIKMARV